MLSPEEIIAAAEQIDVTVIQLTPADELRGDAIRHEWRDDT